MPDEARKIDQHTCEHDIRPTQGPGFWHLACTKCDFVPLEDKRFIMTITNSNNTKKPWQCHLGERDWAIVFFAWDNALGLAEATTKFAEFEKLASEMGHHGHCVKEPEACFTCIVADATKEGQEMAKVWAVARPIKEEDKYL